MSRGRFISFEGGEGGGKSTQVRLLAERLRARGHEVVCTREPGGSTGAEALRALLVQGEVDRWSPTAETLILYAAREDHLQRTIRPALAAGAWVICDRFADSTRVYQGHAGRVPMDLVLAIERVTVGENRPDLTLILDLPAKVGLARVASRGNAADRFEKEGVAFHTKLRQGFKAIARAEPERCRLIDASADADAVTEAIRAAVVEHFDIGARLVAS